MRFEPTPLRLLAAAGGGSGDPATPGEPSDDEAKAKAEEERLKAQAAADAKRMAQGGDDDDPNPGVPDKIDNDPEKLKILPSKVKLTSKVKNPSKELVKAAKETAAHNGERNVQIISTNTRLIKGKNVRRAVIHLDRFGMRKITY